MTDVVDSILHSDSTVAEKVGDLYGDKQTLKSICLTQDSMEEKDGAHYYGCVNAMVSRKRKWEETTVEHWNKLAQVQSGKTLKLTALNKSIFDQVSNIMEDDVRWRKRCTVLRGGYQVCCYSINLIYNNDVLL